MKVAVVRPDELGDTEFARWHAFQQATPSLANPFLSPEFTVAVGQLRSRARVAVLSEGTDIVGFFPFERGRLGAGVPISAGLADCQGLVHAPGVDWDPIGLLRDCGLAVWEFDHLVDSQQPFESYQVTRAASPVMDLTGDDQDPGKVGLAGKSLRRLLKQERSLTRHVGELRVVFASRDRRDLYTVMAWKSAQYLRTGLYDQFARAWVVRLVERLLEAGSKDCTGLLSMLYAGETPIAGHFGLRSQPALTWWFPAYDVSYAKYSPGLLLQMRVAQEAAAAGIAYMDMGKGAEGYKQMFKTRDLFVGQGRVARSSPAAALHSARRVATDRLRHTVKSRPALSRIGDSVYKHCGRIDAAVRRAARSQRTRTYLSP